MVPTPKGIMKGAHQADVPGSIVVHHLFGQLRRETDGDNRTTGGCLNSWMANSVTMIDRFMISVFFTYIIFVTCCFFSKLKCDDFLSFHP